MTCIRTGETLAMCKTRRSIAAVRSLSIQAQGHYRMTSFPTNAQIFCSDCVLSVLMRCQGCHPCMSRLKEHWSVQAARSSSRRMLDLASSVWRCLDCRCLKLAGSLAEPKHLSSMRRDVASCGTCSKSSSSRRARILSELGTAQQRPTRTLKAFTKIGPKSPFKQSQICEGSR